MLSIGIQILNIYNWMVLRSQDFISIISLNIIELFHVQQYAVANSLKFARLACKLKYC